MLWQSFSTLTTATSQAAPAPAAVAGRQSADTSSVSGGGPRASTTARDNPEIDRGAGLTALLDKLELTEEDVLAKMSKRDQARLGIGQGRKGTERLCGKAAHDL